MTSKLLYKNNILTGLMPSVIALTLLGLQLNYRITAFGTFGKEYLIFDTFWIVVDIGLCIIALKDLIVYLLAAKGGNAKKCMEAYEINEFDLDDDMLDAEHIGKLYVGHKYAMFTGRKPVIIPIDRIVAATMRLSVHTTVYNFIIKVIQINRYIILTDDYGINRTFPVRGKQGIERVFDLLLSREPAIITPYDREYKTYRDNYQKARSIVEKRKQSGEFCEPVAKYYDPNRRGSDKSVKMAIDDGRNLFYGE